MPVRIYLGDVLTLQALVWDDGEEGVYVYVARRSHVFVRGGPRAGVTFEGTAGNAGILSRCQVQSCLPGGLGPSDGGQGGVVFEITP